MKIDGAYKTFQGWFSVPMPFPVRRGQGPTPGAFDEFNHTLYPHEHETPKIEWHIHDIRDSRAPESIESWAEQEARTLAIYPDLALEELLLGSASTYLHPEQELTNIFGGTGLFSNSHSFNGQTLDNQLAGSGTSIGNIADDLYAIHQANDEMVNSEGYQFWTLENTEKAKWCVVVPPELRQVFDALFDQTMFIEAGAISSSGNYVKNKYGGKVDVKVFEPLSDASDWYAFRTNPEDGLFPLVYGEKDGPEKDVWLMSQGNEWSLRTKKEAIRWRMRCAFGYGVPQTAHKVTNS
ncbi:MAG: hypothetical protein ACPHCN_12680 [Mycobacterium sp.]